MNWNSGREKHNQKVRESNLDETRYVEDTQKINASKFSEGDGAFLQDQYFS